MSVDRLRQDDANRGLAAHCAEFLAYFRRTYRPSKSDREDYEYHVREFERDLDRLVHEITTLAYRNAQAPFVEELYQRRNHDVWAAALSPLPPKGPA